MKKVVFALAVLVAFLVPQTVTTQESNRWDAHARNVTITRDDWGIAHIHGKTDADAVFGMIYAQAEDDFNRVETNFINSQGRLAEAEGESQIWRDLRMKLFIDPDAIKKDYAASPAFLKALMDAWADGLNFYLAKHPQVKPRVITKFEPWMALTFSEGSIGGDIEHVNLATLQAFYSAQAPGDRPDLKVRPSSVTSGAPDLQVRGQEVLDTEPRGSNGMAVAPSNTTGKHALLLINPHTSFFFRSELQMTSDEGLNAYGASTWGQFFLYQGFNERIGWMHTTSAVDDWDEYLETIVKKGDKYFYKHGTQELPVTEQKIDVPYKTATGMAKKTFTVYRTQHGPVVRASDGKWVSIAIMQEPLKALTQSYTRTKAKNYDEFKKVMDLHSNSSNNTIYADADGTIAYFHSNFIPRRDPNFDWTKPVDGSNPSTDWKGLLGVDESPNLKSPASGWIYNSNDWPWAAAGPSSRKQTDFPAYVDSGTESARGRHAVRVLQSKKDFTLDGLIGAAYDSYLPWFEKPLPALIKAYDALAATNPLKAKLADQIALLKKWDLRWGVASVPTSLGVYWGDEVQRRVGGAARTANLTMEEYLGTKAPAEMLLNAMAMASDKLAADFGKWQTPWGDINRFQRLTDDIVHPFTDAGASIPVGFTSATWGSLASFGARAYNGSKKIYGTSGNSFVAVVEFGPTVRAKAVSAGGESGDPKSKHFNDQALRYSKGELRDVYFYPADLKGHTERTYQPGK